MKLEQKPTFQRAYKKLHPNQRQEVNNAIRTISNNPEIGTRKIADLSDFRIYKFKINNQEYLLAYTYIDVLSLITLYAISSHQNFYRDLKKNIQKN